MKYNLSAGTAIAALALTIASQASAETKTLYVGMNGGEYEKIYTEHTFLDFEKANDVKIVIVPGTSADIFAKATAQKSAPQMHVMLLDDAVMVRAINGGLCQKITDDPVLADIQPAARMKDDMAIGIDIDMTGIGYNKKMFDEKGWPAPTSWLDMADPKFANAVVFPTIGASSFGLHGFLMFNRAVGGDEKNVEPGFTKFRDMIGKNVLEYTPAASKISEMVQTGEAAIFPISPQSINAMKSKGLPVAYAQPKEGSVSLNYAECVIAGNNEPELSQKLAHYLLSAEAQSKSLDFGGVVPSNVKVKAGTPEAQTSIDLFNGYMKNVQTLDFDAVNASRPDWVARWNRTIEK